MEPIQPGLIIVAGSMGVLLLGLIALTALLTLGRQRRARKHQQLLTDTSPYKPNNFKLPAEYVPQIPALPTVKQVLRKSITNDQTEPIPEQYRLKTQEGTPEQVVIQIDPLEGPTRDQRNVQKLIAYLKEESARTDNPAPTSTKAS